MRISTICVLGVAIAVAGSSAIAPAAAPPPPDTESMAPIIVETIHLLEKPKAQGGRAGGGYDLHKRFTQNLDYAGAGTLKASTPAPGAATPYKTMCVAAVVEIIVEALSRWATAHPQDHFTQDLPVSRWTNGTRTGVIANIFMYKGTDSRGTGNSLQKLGMGKEKPFEALRPGDFVNFNRTNNTGHAVVFMGYLHAGSGTPHEAFSGQVVGFRYFSAQGMNRADGGFGYRNAYFLNKCPTPRGRNDDCNIIGIQVKSNGTVTQNKVFFNTGEMLIPAKWTIKQAYDALRADVSRGFEDDPDYRDAGTRDAAVAAVLAQKLEPDEQRFVDGSED